MQRETYYAKKGSVVRYSRDRPELCAELEEHVKTWVRTFPTRRSKGSSPLLCMLYLTVAANRRPAAIVT